jgi:hypothetical protein
LERARARGKPERNVEQRPFASADQTLVVGTFGDAMTRDSTPGSVI